MAFAYSYAVMKAIYFLSSSCNWTLKKAEVVWGAKKAATAKGSQEVRLVWDGASLKWSSDVLLDPSKSLTGCNGLNLVTKASNVHA